MKGCLLRDNATSSACRIKKTGEIQRNFYFCAMIFHSDSAKEVALHLLKINAIKLRPENPFTWASGLHSPIYCDNRLALSYPDIRTAIQENLSRAIQKHFPGTQVIAGVATAGIPQGVLVAQQLNLPFVYVRSAAKSHGMTNRIEGHMEKSQKAVVVEDLVSTGKSSLAAVEALREAGADVLGMVSIFTYDLPVARENFKKAGCPLVSLSDYHHLTEVALAHGYIDQTMTGPLQEWRKDPQKWSDAQSRKNSSTLPNK